MTISAEILTDDGISEPYYLQPIIAARDGRDLQIPPGILPILPRAQNSPGKDFAFEGGIWQKPKCSGPPNPSRRERQLSAVNYS